MRAVDRLELLVDIAHIAAVGHGRLQRGAQVHVRAVVRWRSSDVTAASSRRADKLLSVVFVNVLCDDLVQTEGVVQPVLVVARLAVVSLVVVRVDRVLVRLPRVPTVRVVHHAHVRVVLVVRARLLPPARASVAHVAAVLARLLQC